ncbi:disease resistance protein Pik-2-like [Miscanthus floridulus]|uniref:disease resistance protein Pik-2-like n=1 Tax=Miscanthus floridulus TaxID=154761 RepID=UPI0034592C81
MDIVVGALSGIVDALPGKLGELLEQEYALLSGVRGDVVFLQAELSSMHAAIHHCESLDHHDSQTSGWIGLVREVAYDIEDWVDLFSIRVDGGAQSTSGFRAWIRRCVDKLTALPARHTIASELQGLKERVLEISEQRNRYRLGAMVGTTSQHPHDPRLSALFVYPGSLVGLDGKVEDMFKTVMDAGGTNELKIVSIVGMAGSGKTTLANAVYQRLQADNTFQCSAFVSIGPKADMVKTVKDMLSKLGEQHRGGEDISQLIHRVREILEKKRYLIAIDDLWSSEQWGAIWCCFPDNNLGSRIITTTRNDALPTNHHSGSSKFVHKIGLLTDNEAKELFLKKAFSSRNDCPQHLEDAFTRVLRRCAGLPLAVVSIAAKLAPKQSRDEWEKHGLNLLCSSHPDGLDGLKQILDLSYNDLQPHLRSCFLYLSIFPENSEIETERLVRRWIAEGFITGSKEETAISYLKELIDRNLVQPLGLNHDSIPRRCRVHPVIYDFIVCKSMEDNLATLTDAQHILNNNRTVRRLSLNLKNNSKGDQPAARNESTDLSHARSVTVFGHASATPHLTDLKVVRVLDLEGCNGPVCLDGLCKLVLLRYLSLKGTDVSELPEAIGDLRCLETLDVRSTMVEELPPSIVRLEKIMHLLAGSAKLPGGMDKMKAMRSLSCAGTTKSSANVVEEFSKHDNLRDLELYYYATETPGNEKQIMFPGNGLKTVKQLCIRCTSPSVTFEPHVLPKVQALELRFEKGRADESSGVSGLEHLSSLKHLVLEFEQHDAGAMATVDGVRKAAEGLLLDRQYITIKVDGKNY